MSANRLMGSHPCLGHRPELLASRKRPPILFPPWHQAVPDRPRCRLLQSGNWSSPTDRLRLALSR
eukprot:12021751-Alexandrium_andersonii.AAC.1